MRIALLPSSTQPPDEPQRRRHEPRIAADYDAYRRCIRWDFGFTCAFCLLHERDFCPDGTGGTGAMTIEHLVPQSQGVRQNDYGNLVYACRFCNGSRRAVPLHTDEGGLLDPTRAAWADHFVTRGDELLPVEGNRDAAHTANTYDLNDERKVRRRETRRTFRELFDALSAARRDAAALVEMADEAQSLDRKLELLALAESVRKTSDRSDAVCSRLAVRPDDAPSTCRCNDAETLDLPPWLARQAFVVDVGTPERPPDAGPYPGSSASG